MLTIVETLGPCGRVYRVRTAFTVPPLRGDIIVYPGRGVARDDDLLLEVLGRRITVGHMRAPALDCRVDSSVPDEDALELLAAFKFTEVADG